MNKDEDIRIASPYPSREEKRDIDKITENISKELTLQKENGNLEKAKEIGKRLAFDTYNYKFEIKDVNIDEAMEQEIKMLHIFSVFEALEKYSPNEVVKETASSVFTNALRDLDKDYYGRINTSGAYSMYLLNFRRTNLDNEVIGDLFANQIGFADDDMWKKTGMEIFLNTRKNVKNKILQYEFK